METEIAASPSDPESPAAFDWRVYADATCAGLSALIPLPLVDLAFEGVFRRRMPQAVARARGARLDPTGRGLLARGGGCLPTASSCLAVPLWAARYVVKKLWRKLVYVLSVVDAVEQTSRYWHRAYLMDHVVRSGHLAPGRDVGWTAACFDAALDRVDTGAVRGVARQVVTSTGHVGRLLVRARRGTAEQAAARQEDFLRSRWPTVQRALARTVPVYEELRRQRTGAPEAAARGGRRSSRSDPSGEEG